MATRASFNHSCLKTPLHPVSRMPSPGYERPSGDVERDIRATPSPACRSSRINSANKASRASSASGPRSRVSSATTSKRPASAGVKNTGASLVPLLNFYESIPDYSELGHLSDREFYAKVHELRQTQRAYVSTLAAAQQETPHQSRKTLQQQQDRWTAGVQGVRCVLNDSRTTTPVPAYLGSPCSSSARSARCSPPTWTKATPAWGKVAREVDPHSYSNISTPLSSPRRATPLPVASPKRPKSRPSRPAYNTRVSPDRAHPSSHSPDNRGRNTAGTVTTRVGSARRTRGGGITSSVWDIDDEWLAGGSLSEGELANPLSDSEEELLRTLRSSSQRNHRVKNVAWREPQFTVPHPFEMTRREEDERYFKHLRRELLDMDQKPVQKPPRTPSPTRRSHEVPLTSRLPLFHGILLQQELRRERQKRRSKAKLLSRIRPFSFDNDDLQLPPPNRRLMRKLWQSSPELRELSRVRGGGEEREFRARPMPHHIYSAETYLRHQEDEFIKVLKRRIRAEETLRDASLPPSMATRTLIPHPSCRPYTATPDYSPPPQSRRQHSAPISKSSGSRRSRAVSPYDENLHRSRTETCSPYEPRTNYEAAAWRTRSSTRPHSATTGNVSPIRHNLAAVLRIESCSRRRAELEAAKQREHQRNIEEARVRARVMRRRPAWRSMAHISARREIALRAVSRREEERSRQQEHARQMGRMMGRVLGIPTLFERQTQESLRYRVEEQNVKDRVVRPRSPRKSTAYSPEHSTAKFVTPLEPHISFYPGNGEQISRGYNGEEKQDEPEFCDKHEVSKSPPATSRYPRMSREASRESVHESMRRASVVSRQNSKEQERSKEEYSRQNSKEERSKELSRESSRDKEEVECPDEELEDRVSTPCTERAN